MSVFEMFSVSLILMLFYLKYSLGIHKVPCNNDHECVINAMINRVYPRFVAGMPGVDSSDPLHLDTIIVDLPTIKYELKNASLIGLKDCQFTTINFTKLSEYTHFHCALECPLVTLLSEYELNGLIDSVPVEGKGTVKITYEDYHIAFIGKHQKVKDDAGKLHIKITEFTVKANVKGDVSHPEYDNLIFSNNESCDHRVKLLEEMTRETVMDVFMNKYIENVKDFQKHVPVEDVHYKYVQ